MDKNSTTMKVLLLIGAIGVGILMFFGPDDFMGPIPKPTKQQADTPPAQTSAPIPNATPVSTGQTLYDKNCASCHGQQAKGTDNGPTFIHKVYEPNHHGDMSFVLAAKRGVRAHHWRFGNMPAQPQVNEQQVREIIKYVRKLQKQAGIF